MKLTPYILAILAASLLASCQTAPVYEPDGYYHYPDLPHRVFYPSGPEDVTVVITGTPNHSGYYHVRHGEHRYIYAP